MSTREGMALLRPKYADKIIVDRTKAHRNTDVARAVRRMRDRLAQQSRDPDFERELLKLHALAMIRSAPVIPLLVVVVAVVGLFIGLGVEILLWALVTVVSHLFLAIVARRIARSETSTIEVRGARREFLIGHIVSGIGWGYFATLACNECGVGNLPVLQAVVLLIVIAATAIIASSLKGSLIATFAFPVTVYAVVSARVPLPVDSIMAGVLVASIPFFDYIARHLHESAIMLLSFRREKDGLIAELETAKSLSDEARRRAEEANLAKSRFLASMSHELRTPLNAILGFSEVMAKEVLGPMNNPSYRDYARDVHESGKHLLDLINEILDLSRIEAGRYRLNEEPIRLTHVAEDCCHMMELKARNKDIRIVQQFHPDLPRLVADERAVRQIILNLMANAIKFTPTGSDVHVKVGWTAGGGQYVSIKDNGPGIPAEEIPVVLSAFGQGSIAIKNAEQGTGLGLPIVQGLLAMHGGEFQLLSKLREGTEAIAIFPNARVMEELPAVPTKVAAEGGRRR